MTGQSSVTKPFVSIVVPAYNEENGLGDVLQHLLALEFPYPYEVILVNDGSSDGTGKVAAQFDAITLVEHHRNQGYGASLKDGIRRAKGDLICITDADGTYPNERIPEIVQYMIDQGLDMAVAARTGQNVSIPLVRRPAKWVIRKFASYVAGMSIPDLNSGLRVFKRETALNFFNILPDGFSFTTTITLGMLTNGHRVDYVPIDYHQRVGRSKIKPIQDTLNFVQLISRIGLYFQPLRVFVPASILLLLLAVLWALFSELVLGKLADVSVLVLAMTAVQIYAIGMLAELINRRIPSAYTKDDITSR